MTNLTNAMNKQDKFFEQFKEAAHQTEQHRFPGIEDVWQQVETRLDKENKPKVFSIYNRKMLAVAAALLAMIIVGVVYFQGDRNVEPIIAVEKEEQLPIIEDLDNILEEDTIKVKKALVINKIAQNKRHNENKVEKPNIISPMVFVKDDSVMVNQYLDGLTSNVKWDSTNKDISLVRPILRTELESQADILIYNFQTTKKKSKQDDLFVMNFTPQKPDLNKSVAGINQPLNFSFNRRGNEETILQGRLAGVQVNPG